MQLVSLTLPSPAANLALDEALLESAESGAGPANVLRLWESPQDAVILGRASKHQNETDFQACQQARIPVLRRCSGGATVMIGPGCLMYAVVLSYDDFPFLRHLDRAHQFVMERILAAVQNVGVPAEFQGTCDLTLHDRKFSGNSLRCKRTHLLYHGTLLYNYELHKIQRFLGTPPRQPDYRQQRSHDQFLVNLEVTRERLEAALRDAWQADESYSTPPLALSEQLEIEKYRRDDWNLRL